MGAGSAGTSNDSGGKDTKTPFGKASSTKTKTKFGYTKPKSKFKTFIEGGGVIGSVTQPFRDKMLNVNTKFFNEKVVPAGKIKKGTTYESYMKARLAGKIDAYGNPTPNQGGGNDNQVAQSPLEASTQPVNNNVTTAPSMAEVSQSEAANADDIYTRRKKSKARGRSMMTLTSSKGVTDNKLTLGKPSLLGS